MFKWLGSYRVLKYSLSINIRNEPLKAIRNKRAASAMTEGTVAEWSPKLTAAEITEAGAFGPDVRFVSFEPDDRRTGQDHFASTVLFGTVTVRDGDGEACRRLVIKRKPRQPEVRKFLGSDLHFQNEILFYERILPFLRALLPAGDEHRAPPACRYYYGRSVGHALEDLIALEDDTVRGYRPSRCDHRLFMDFDHVIVALRTLAKFHGLSYRAKHTDPTNFADLTKRIAETQWTADNTWRVRKEAFDHALSTVVMGRLAERNGGEYGGRLSRFRADHLGDTMRTLRKTMEPGEPASVLCHGDFNRNNMLFRYDDTTGRPVDALPFDMATVRYGSPALDLSFFLYTNADRRLRDERWDELLDEYSATLEASVSDVSPAVWVPNREQLGTEMRDRAFYGLSHVLFFSRIMMDEQKKFDLERYCKHDDHTEQAEYLLSFGSVQATDAVADVLQHYIDLRYHDVPRIRR